MKEFKVTEKPDVKEPVETKPDKVKAKRDTNVATKDNQKTTVV